mgnify:CR=1 FL=1
MAQKPETPLWLHDIAASLGLLTRLPVKVDADLAMTRSAAATWAYPVVGLLLGGFALGVFMVCYVLGLPPLVALVLVLGGQIILTGAMHEDGLADSADGLWGGWTVERRLEIMKDSSIGVYGVCAIAVILLLKATALATLVMSPLFALALFGGAALSRAGMVVLMHALPAARGGGLGQSVGKPPLRSVLIAIGIACGATVLLGVSIGHVWAALLMIVVTGVAAWGCAQIARAKIKGFTGDILGATQQVCDVAALVALSAFAY